MNRPSAEPLTIRSANREDVGLMVQLIRELAEYEREPKSAVATEEDLLRDGFDAPVPLFQCLIAEWDGEPAGFAFFFKSYSTWHGRPGIHLEDLFVREHVRARGIGKALLKAVARVAADEGCTRLNWHVLDWNQPAIDFYEHLGAKILKDWRICRLSRDALSALAEGGEKSAR
ncbi:MAG: GNAT family N-acetyltransferase [Bryobacteraceae bacterium]